jgi:hypothetical protein
VRLSEAASTEMKRWLDGKEGGRRKKVDDGNEEQESLKEAHPVPRTSMASETFPELVTAPCRASLLKVVGVSLPLLAGNSGAGHGLPANHQDQGCHTIQSVLTPFPRHTSKVDSSRGRPQDTWSSDTVAAIA